MQSAFGVEHSNIEKALGGKRKKAIALERQARVTANRAKMVARGQTVRNATLKAVTTPVSVADVGTGVGRTVAGIGRVATKAPGVTGAAVIGGGGYAAYKTAQSRGKKKAMP